MKTYLVELNAYDTSTSTIITLYWSSESFKAFSNNDTDRPNQYYEPRLIDIGVMNKRMFSQGKTSGQSSINGGIITVSNADNALDYLLNFGLDGRDVRVFLGDIGSSFNTFTEIMNGTIKQPIFSFSKGSEGQIKFVIRDKRQKIEHHIQTNLYLGTNSGATGNEGLPQDIKGNPKPLCFGYCQNVSAIPVNTSALRYQVHDGQINDVIACYDKGVQLTKVTTQPAAGQYSVDTMNGIITLGSTPAGSITCDVYGAAPSGVYKTTVADIVEHILLTYGGISTSEINSASLSALNTKNSSIVGIYVDSQTNITNIIDKLCGSIGAYWFFDRLGMFIMGRFEAPALSSSTFSDNDLIELERVQSSDEDKGIPSHRVIVTYSVNFTVQSSDSLAGGVTESRRAFLEKDVRSAYSTDSNVIITHPLATAISRESFLVYESDALSEASRVLNLYNIMRDFYKIILPNDVITSQLNLGDTITIKINRFGLNQGKDFIITALADQSPDVGKTEIEIWG